MKTNERWLCSIVLLVSVLPLVALGLVRTFVDGPFILEDLATGTIYKLNDFQVTYTGIFCIIPIVIMIVARTLRTKELINAHFRVVAYASLALSLVYAFSILYILIATLRDTKLSVAFTKIDYFTLITTIACIVVGVFATALPSLKPTPVFGVKNHYTMAHPDIWLAVNNGASTALTYIFLLGSVLSSHIRGPWSITVFLAGCAVYYVWVAVYSVYKHRQFVVTHPNDEILLATKKK